MLGALPSELSLPEILPDSVEYRLPWGTSWYRNDEFGVEQGFTIDERPEGKGDLRVTLTFAGLTPVFDDGSQITFADIGGTDEELYYTDLVAYDAAGTPLPAHMELFQNQVSLVVEDTGAEYPVTIDPRFGGGDAGWVPDVDEGA